MLGFERSRRAPLGDGCGEYKPSKPNTTYLCNYESALDEKQSYFLLLGSNELLLKSLIQNCKQEEGCYLFLDRQIMAEALIQFAVYASDGVDLDKVVVNPHLTAMLSEDPSALLTGLTEQQKNDTRYLAILLLEQNSSIFPDNAKIIQKLMEPFSGLGRGMKGVFSHITSPFEAALSAINLLKTKLEERTQECEQLKATLVDAVSEKEDKSLLFLTSQKRKMDPESVELNPSYKKKRNTRFMNG